MAERSPRALDLVVIGGVVLFVSACAAKSAPPAARLDLNAPDAHPYLVDVKTRLQERLTYPCVRNATSGTCDPQTTQVGIDFGVLGDGSLAYVTVIRTGSDSIYDTTATEAVRSAAPVPPVPAEVMARVPAQGTGIPIRANFHFVVQPAPR